MFQPRMRWLPLFLALFAPGTVFAYEHWHGDIRHFHEYDWRLWHAGRWYHARHGGALGWWWVADGIWYYYPKPVYPYPDPYAPPVIVQSAPVIVQQTPVLPPAPPPPTPPQNWYYCNNPHGYYPYVPTCPAGWVMVPATPPPGAPAGIAPPGTTMIAPPSAVTGAPPNQ